MQRELTHGVLRCDVIRCDAIRCDFIIRITRNVSEYHIGVGVER